MVIICILGDGHLLCKMLEDIGYNRLMKYAVNSHSDTHKCKSVTDLQMQHLLDKGIIVGIEEENGIEYGLSKPLGESRNVVEVGLTGLEAYKGLYQSQVIGVSIGDNLGSSLIDLVVSEDSSRLSVLNSVLKLRNNLNLEE